MGNASSHFVGVSTHALNSTGGPSRPTSSNGTPGRYCHARSHKDHVLALSEQAGDDDGAAAAAQAAAYGCDQIN